MLPRSNAHLQLHGASFLTTSVLLCIRMYAGTTTIPHHRLAGLSCDRFGGPNNSFAEREMVYWSDIPSDHLYLSPFRRANDEEQFLTFEPDHGGWNNIRMAMETILVLAHAMGRTLVLPPEQKMYLLKDVSLLRIAFTLFSPEHSSRC